MGVWGIIFDLVDSDCVLVHQHGRMSFELVRFYQLQIISSNVSKMFVKLQRVPKLNK